MPDWDVSLVTEMSELFYGKGSFNADISRWDTSSVTNMYRMFRDAGLFNQDIGAWDTWRVTTMHEMFRDADAFNQHLSRWDVSSVTNMQYMFKNTDAFNTMPVGWDISTGTLSNMIFEYAVAWPARFEGGTDSTLPGGGWTRKDNACDASYPPLNGDVGNCTDTLVSGTSCVPDVRRRVRAGGRDVVHRPGADGSCVRVAGSHRPGPSSRRRWTRAWMLMRFWGQVTMLLGQVTCWQVPTRTMSVRCQGKTRLEAWTCSLSGTMSQVTDAHDGMFAGSLELPAGHQGLDPGVRRRRHGGDVRGRRHLALACLARRHGSEHDGRATRPLGSFNRAAAG